ncbi:DUF2637 domain-containing protein [Rhodococcus hoagii]|nr:DUF2637 domain-containing protein [Prescottella equi]
MTLILAALAFTLSFDALRALAIDIGVRPQRAWMAPVAIDIAQAAATAGLVVIGVADKYKAARWYCMGLATLTVLLSVAGNSYHAYGLAQQNLARVGAGQDLGFTPQPPIVAACIAAIFPLLWLALLHLFTIMLRVIVDERTAAATSANMQEPAMMQRASAPERTTTPSTGRNDAAGAGTDPVDVAHDDASAEHHDTEPATVDASASQHDVAADVPVAIDTPATSHVDVIEDDLVTTAAPRATIPDIDGAPMQDLDPAPAVTRTGYPQTHAGLLDFLVDVDLSDQVKKSRASSLPSSTATRPTLHESSTSTSPRSVDAGRLSSQQPRPRLHRPTTTAPDSRRSQNATDPGAAASLNPSPHRTVGRCITYRPIAHTIS